MRATPPDALDYIRASFARFFAPFTKAWRKANEQNKRERQTRLKQAAVLAERPPGWAGHWSARYGQVLARTLKFEPPFTRSQNEMLGAIPRPLREALDPVASVAEPVDRDGNLVARRLARSAILDLFSPIALVFGVLVFAIVAFTIAVPRLGLPPLTAPAAAPQPPQARPQPQILQPPDATQPRAQQARPQPQVPYPPPGQQKQQLRPPQAEAPFEGGLNRQQGQSRSQLDQPQRQRQLQQQQRQ